MNIKKVKDDIYMLSMGIDRMLFESIWDTPHGVTLNSYIVRGEKTAIIDGFIGWDGMAESLYKGLSKIDINPEDIDYLILNHLEPDHSGWIEDFLKINNHFKIFVTQKGADMFKSFYSDSIDVEIVKEGDTLNLGQGKVLSFHPVPNVHWPETMLTYESHSKALFTCDLYGAFGSMPDHVFDDELTLTELDLFEEEGMRYFSNVMMTFSTMVERAIKKTESLDVEVIAPGHGPIYRKNPKMIIDAYKRYCQYAKGYGKNEVMLLWGSMYGMTQRVVEDVVAFLTDQGIKVNALQVPQATKSDIVLNAFKSAAIIFAAPTYEYKLFPPMAHAIDEIGRKKMTGKYGFRFGSFGWSGGAEKEFNQLFESYRLKWNFIESTEFKGMAKSGDYQAVKEKVSKLIEVMNDKII